MHPKYNSLLIQSFHTEKIAEYALDKIRDACVYFGHPEKSFHSIHIAGTNGKGSVSKMIYQILKESGKRVGVYTSPHNIDIRERFETGDGLISEEDFVRLAEEVIDYGHDLSYYERCTLLAFLYFREQECEYAVIEVGMGGRLDATNIITPILSVITSISYDHMEYLGDTLEQIAFEKGGIIKPYIPLILYGENPTLEMIARERNAEIIFPQARAIHTNLAGEHQISNGRIAYEVGVFLGVAEDIIQSALMHVTHHGRLEYISPNLLIDGAHNEDGLQKLRTYLESEQGKWQEIIYCFNLKKGKSARLVLDTFPHVQSWMIVQTDGHMVQDAQEICEEVRMLGGRVEIHTPETIRDMSHRFPQKLFVVFGSLYMIGEFYR